MQGKMAGNAQKFRSLLIAWLAVTSAATLASAQTEPAVLRYPRAFFDGAQLATAYDMISRLPGFVYDSGNDARGYDGTAGNVLIDGERPTAKTDDLTTILKRVPVSRVDHVEVIRGGAPGIDMQGQAVVANVVLAREDSTTAILTLQNLFYGNGHDVPYGNLEFSRRAGGEVYDLTLSRYGTNWDDSIGDGTGTFRAPGKPDIVVASKRAGADKLGWGLNASAGLPFLGGHFGVNATAEAVVHNMTILYAAPEAAIYFDGEKTRAAEFGLTWDGMVGMAEVNLVGLQRFNRAVSLQTSDNASGFQLFDSVQDTDESILRGTARYHPSEALTLEGGLEGAFNGLKGTSNDTLDGVAQILIGADSRVHESRGEAFLQASWRISPRWSLEAGARGEYSVIAAEAVPSRRFAFFKPRLLLSWSPFEGQQLRLRLERVVGQLDFSNFVASANFSGNGLSAGNIALRPDQRWQIEGDYELHFWDRGAFTFSVMHEDITDLVDYVPIGHGQDGPGNVPKAINNQFDLEFSLPLDKAGFEGSLLKGSLLWRDSALKDPVTGETRSISNKRDRNIVISWFQDAPAIHSSFDLDFTPSGFSQPSYRIAQVSTFRIRSAYVTASWDYKPTPDLDFLFQMQNFIPYRFDQEQDNYAGPRNISPLVQIQDQRIATLPHFLLQLRKTF